MTRSAEILLQLLRGALGNGPEEGCDLSAVSAEEWTRVVDMAFDQGVAALSVDGYNSVTGGERCLMDSDEMEDLRFEWFGSVLQAEDDFRKQLRAARRMAEIFAAEGLRTYVLKGFSVAELYPEPSHRECCDCDVFLGEGFELGNGLMEREGVKVDRSFYKNSAFRYRGLMVENHRFCSPARGGRRRKEYERYLEEIVGEGAERIGDSQLWRPGALFTALLVTSHAQVHFLVDGGIGLRHVCDFALCVGKLEELGLWERYVEDCRRFGLWRFAVAMAGAAERVCGVRMMVEEGDGLVVDRLVEEVCLFGSGSVGSSGSSGSSGSVRARGKMATRLGMVGDILRGGWKFRLFSDRSALGTLGEIVFGFLFEKKVKL